MGSKVSFLNGEFLPHEKCFVHIEDRGFQFGDGVYEVVLFVDGKLIDGNPHVDRLFRSLEKIGIQCNYSKTQIMQIMHDLFAKNNLASGSCYLQITRGKAESRLQNCPSNLAPTISATVSPRKIISKEDFQKGISVITHEDIRWLNCDIKSTNLLAATLLNQKAKDAGADDVILIRGGFITEASFANVFIVNKEGVLITKDADNFVLQGITRNRLIDIAKKAGFKVEERKFDLDELMQADEVFLSSTTLLVRPVSQVNGKKFNVGKYANFLQEAYLEFIAKN